MDFFFLEIAAKLGKNSYGSNRTTKTAIKFELSVKLGVGVEGVEERGKGFC